MYKEVRTLAFSSPRSRKTKPHQEYVTRNASENKEHGEENADTREDTDNIEAATQDLYELEPALGPPRKIVAAKDISKEHEFVLKCVKILKNVPKSPRARTLMKYLSVKAVLTSIAWDDGIVSIDSNLIKNSNIVGLINNAREKIQESNEESSVRTFTACLKHSRCTNAK